MNWLRNLKIFQKILVFIGISVLFILINGGIGIYFSSHAAKNMDTMYKDRVMPLYQLGISRANIKQLEADSSEMSTKKDPENVKELSEIDFKLIAQTEKLMADYGNTYLLPYEVENFAKFKQLLPEIKKFYNEIVQSCKNGNYSNGLYIINYNMEKFDSIAEIMNNLAEFNKKIAADIHKENMINSQKSQFISIIVILLALVIEIVIGLFISKIISNPVNEVVAGLNEVSKGNLRVKEVKNDSQDETGVLSKALNSTVVNLRTLVEQVARSVEDISASSEEMSASSDQTAEGAQQTALSTQQLAQGAQEISSNVEKGASTIVNLNKVIQEVSKEAVEVSKLGNQTESHANEGHKQVNNAVTKIDSIKVVSNDISTTISRLGQLSSEIEVIVDLIKNIAGQTNLLALNAAIEAARAGEHGKGFAVVADEVKKLAEQSRGATDKITEMIKEIQSETYVAINKMDRANNEVDEGVQVIKGAGSALENIINQVKTANNKIQGITGEINDVAKSSEEVVSMIENISAITEETAASAEEISSITEEQTASLEEISASAQTLARIAEELNRQVAVFKI